MGKVKSAIITTLLVIAIVVLTVFSTVSFNFADGVKRYNSILSSISLGSDLTGEAYAVLYPEGVISTEDYNSLTAEKKNDYVQHKNSGLYVLTSEYTNINDSILKNLREDVEIISDRFDARGLTGYSVSIVDDYAVKITVDSKLSYGAYSNPESSERVNTLSAISNTVKVLTLDGTLSLRTDKIGVGYSYDPYETDTNSLLERTENVNEYYKGVSVYSMAQMYAVRMNFTKAGKEMVYDVSNDILDAKAEDSSSSSTTTATESEILFYVGNERVVNYSFTEAYSDDILIGLSNLDATKDLVSLFDSVVKGNVVQNEFSYDEVKLATSSQGTNVALFLGIAIGVIILGLIIAFIVMYKKLGLVNAMIVALYALAMICAIQIIGITVTAVGAICAIIGLILLCGSNLFVFEEVRKQTKLGKTMQASVKAAYKNTLFSILDIHVVALIASLVLSLAGAGELAACGLILFVATIASYALYWFTRFMWYVVVSPVKDKFRFGGYTREVYEDD